MQVLPLRGIAPALDAEEQFNQLDRLIGALLGTRDDELQTPSARPAGRPGLRRRPPRTRIWLLEM